MSLLSLEEVVGLITSLLLNASVLSHLCIKDIITSLTAEVETHIKFQIQTKGEDRWEFSKQPL